MENKKYIIREKIESPKIIVEKKKNTLVFYKKHNKVITTLDRVLTKLYEHPIEYLSSLDIDLFEKDKVYYFNYVYKEDPISIKYKVPENKLILVNVSDKRNTKDYTSLDKYNVFGTSVQNELELDNILNIDKTYKEFSYKYDYKHILENERCNGLIVMEVVNDKIVKIHSHKFITEVVKREVTDTNALITKDLLKFVDNIDMSYLRPVTEESFSYIEIIYKLYQMYEKRDVKVNIIDVFKDPIFDLNTDMLEGKLDVSRIDNKPLFKLMLNTFRKDRYINSNFINEEDLKLLKSGIYKINGRVKDREYSAEAPFMTFRQFMKK